MERGLSCCGLLRKFLLNSCWVPCQLPCKASVQRLQDQLGECMPHECMRARAPAQQCDQQLLAFISRPGLTVRQLLWCHVLLQRVRKGFVRWSSFLNHCSCPLHLLSAPHHHTVFGVYGSALLLFFLLSQESTKTILSWTWSPLSSHDSLAPVGFQWWPIMLPWFGYASEAADFAASLHPRLHGRLQGILVADVDC